MKLRTPLGRVRGLGSSHSGTSHFLWQRITALVMIPLTIWFVYSLLRTVVISDQESISNWLMGGLTASAFIILLCALFYHAALGMQVIIEDYVHKDLCKIVLLLLNKFILFAFAIISILAVLRLHLGIIPQGATG